MHFVSAGRLRVVAALSVLLSLAGCGGGGGGSDGNDSGSGPSTYTLTATVSGLAGAGLALKDTAGHQVPVSVNGVVTLGSYQSGSAYSVSVVTQPAGPSQNCTVANGAGMFGAASVAVAVQCSTTSFSVGGTVSGLRAAGLRLQINETETVGVTADGTFKFPTALPSGTAYSIIVAVAPNTPVQGCSIANGKGQVGGADVANVAVTCATLITSTNMEAVAWTGNRIGETLLQLTEYAGLRLSYLNAHLGPTVTESCVFPGDQTPGTVEAAFADNDGSGTLSDGDVVTFTIQRCFVPSLGTSLGKLSGQLTLTVRPPPPGTYRDGFSADITSVVFPINEATVAGTFRAIYTDIDERRTLQAIVSDSGLTITAPSFYADKIAVVDANISKTLDYVAARYEIRTTGHFDSQQSELGRFSFDTPMPITGRLGTFPDTGKEVFQGGWSVLTLPANDSEQNNTLTAALDVGGNGNAVEMPFKYWTSMTNGFFWWDARQAQVYANGFSGLNTRELRQWGLYMMNATPLSDPSNYRIGDKLPVGTPLKLYFSGPIDGTKTRLSFVPAYSGGIVTVPAVLDINGAIVVVRPQQQLEHGVEYELRADNGMIFTTLAVPPSFLNVLRFSTANNLQADAYASPAVAAPGQTVSLKSTRSFSANGSISGVTWRQTGGPAVQINNANTANATFVMPSGVADGSSLQFELTVQDVGGETDSIGATAFVLSDLTQPFFYHRTAQGASAGRAPESAKLTWSGLGTPSPQFSFTGQFQFNFSPAVSADFDLLNLSTFPDIQLGTFPLTTFTRVFSFTQQAGCNDPLGQFVVRDIARGPNNEVVRFAADYEMYCAGATPPMVGSVRVNSTVPLP